MTNDDRVRGRIRADLQDGFDEEIELEMDESRLLEGLEDAEGGSGGTTLDRHFYFKELFRLQSELIKLQDWVATTKQKVVVIFEGRDAAGKGGVIKRITQRLNPRICRVVALPAPSERERSQWYFQRYISHLRPVARSCCSTAAGTIAQASSVSWVLQREGRGRFLRGGA